MDAARSPHSTPAPASDGLAALVPAYDAAPALEGVLRGVLQHFEPGAVIVVDDGSRDATASIARRQGVRLVQHGENRGKGAALGTGFAAARAAGFTHVLTLDADGQHPPECIPLFRAARSAADIVLGSRLAEPAAMPRARLLSNRATAAILSALAGQEIVDGQCGYRLLALDAVAGLPLHSRGFMFESELLVRAARNGARITHVPIPCVYGDESSHIHVARDTMKFLWLVVRSFFW
jgi:glycosyltransferase involved in cell wall biosynthesis